MARKSIVISSINSMRIWDINPKYLCNKHLVAEHSELHAVWNILTKSKSKSGYANHPETKRWQGKLRALFNRHEVLVKELINHSYTHRSPLFKKLAKGKMKQNIFIDTPLKQKKILKEKPCECFTER